MCALKATVIAAVQQAELAIQDLKMGVKHVTRGEPTYVPGQDVTYPETEIVVNIVWTRFQAKEVDNDRVQASDWRGLVFHREGLPDFNVNDLIRVDDTVDEIVAGDYRILYDDKVSVGGAVVLHQLHLRLT